MWSFEYPNFEVNVRSGKYPFCRRASVSEPLNWLFGFLSSVMPGAQKLQQTQRIVKQLRHHRMAASRHRDKRAYKLNFSRVAMGWQISLSTQQDRAIKLTP